MMLCLCGGRIYALRTFEKECDRYHLHLGSEYIFGVNGNSNVGQAVINDYVSMIDHLATILRKLLKDARLDCNQNGKLQQRCWITVLFLAIGRGGEIKFQDFNDWMWHPKYEVLNIGWTELKLMEKYAMSMVPHRNHYLMDCFHCLGSFWSVERSLFRTFTACMMLEWQRKLLQLSVRTCQQDARLTLQTHLL
jgi:hypothetical protein